MKTISPVELNQKLKQNPSLELIDVRTQVEFDEVHASLAINIPLNNLEVREYLAQRNGRSSEPVYVICKSGHRGKQACAEFEKSGFEMVYNVDGGTDGWVEHGLPILRGRKVVSLERQVRIAAGLLVLTGVLLGGYIHQAWLVLSGFAGAGLIFAGLTDWCGMGMLLARLPWNRRKSKA